MYESMMSPCLTRRMDGSYSSKNFSFIYFYPTVQAEDKAEVLNKELLATKSQLTEAEEEKKQWELEANQVKEMCRRELDRLDTEIKRSNTIIADYKQVCVCVFIWVFTDGNEI